MNNMNILFYLFICHFRADEMSSICGAWIYLHDMFVESNNTEYWGSKWDVELSTNCIFNNSSSVLTYRLVVGLLASDVNLDDGKQSGERMGGAGSQAPAPASPIAAQACHCHTTQNKSKSFRWCTYFWHRPQYMTPISSEYDANDFEPFRSLFGGM